MDKFRTEDNIDFSSVVSGSVIYEVIIESFIQDPEIKN
jgi:hypothetical protein